MGTGSNHDKDSPPAADARLQSTPIDPQAPTKIGSAETASCPTCNRCLQSEYTVCPYDGTPLADKYAIGKRISGKYEILGQLGAGGMGVVYKVRQILVNRMMALKRMHGKALSAEGLVRFQQEAKATFRLHHNNIVSVHDFDFCDDDPYLVMEYVDGQPLSKLIKDQTRLPLDSTIQIAIQIADALAHAHETGILHRDLKPANIMILTKNRGDETKYVPKILDFGIAKSLDPVSGDTQQLTKTGQAVGSPLYMSPEQCEGKKLDQRSDIYSLGCVIYECLTSLPPLQRDSVLSTMMAHIHEKPLSLREASLGIEYPPEIEAMVARLLEKDPALRYQTMREVQEDLIRIQSGNPSPLGVIGEPDHPEQVHRSKRKIFWILLLAGLAAFTCVVGAIEFAQYQDQIRRKTTPVAVPQNNSAEVHQDASKTDNLISYLYDTGKLKDRVDFSNSDITDDGLRILSTIKTIHKLYLAKTAITDKGVHYIAGLSNINVLDLSNTRITDASANSIARLRGLAALYVANNPKIGSDLVSSLGRLPLLELDVRNTNLCDADLDTISIIAPALKELDIADNPRIDSEGLKHCARLRYLMLLDASNTGITDEGLQSLAGNHDLTTVNLSGTNIAKKGLSDLTRGCQNIYGLYLNKVKVDDASIDDIMKLGNIEHLDIRNTDITDDGLLRLAKCKTLMDLAIDGSRVTEKGVRAFRRMSPTVDLVSDYTWVHLPIWLPTDKASTEQPIEVYIHQAKKLIEAKKYNEAIVDCNRILLLYEKMDRIKINEPGFVQANQIKAQCLLKLGRGEEAAREARRMDRIGETAAAAAIKQVLKSK